VLDGKVKWRIYFYLDPKRSGGSALLTKGGQSYSLLFPVLRPPHFERRVKRIDLGITHKKSG
jgi:hypothetical protein